VESPLSDTEFKVFFQLIYSFKNPISAISTLHFFHFRFSLLEFKSTAPPWYLTWEFDHNRVMLYSLSHTTKPPGFHAVSCSPEPWPSSTRKTDVLCQGQYSIHYKHKCANLKKTKHLKELQITADGHNASLLLLERLPLVFVYWSQQK
jgi:hypothetical protein